MIGEGNHHRSSEESYGVSRAYALCSSKYLKRNHVLIQFDYVSVAVAYERKVAVLNALRTYGNYVTDY